MLQFLSFSVERGGASWELFKAGWSRGAVCINDPKSYGVSARLWEMYTSKNNVNFKIEGSPDGPLAKAPSSSMQRAQV